MSSNSSAKKSAKVQKGDAKNANTASNATTTPENVTPSVTDTVVDADVPCTIPFDQITQPGAYVCNWSGHLLRVPEDGVTPGRSPMLNIVGTQSLFVTKICEDPYVSITKARLLACNCYVNVNF